MNDMSLAITPKSDQINADDLIAGPMTITITGVSIKGGQEQPVSISFEGDKGKPWKPCKSMCRVLVSAWGPDAKLYVGRSLTLYRDPSVKWAGMEVGGIRISHMSHIDSNLTMALTATKGSRKPFTVQTLKAAGKNRTVSPDALSQAARDAIDLARLGTDEELRNEWNKHSQPERDAYVTGMSAADKKALRERILGQTQTGF